MLREQIEVGQSNLFAYLNLQPFDADLMLTLGLGYGSLSNTTTRSSRTASEAAADQQLPVERERNRFTVDQLSPKLGLVWSPNERLTFRAALFRTLNRSLVEGKTVEPTQIAGFNQLYDDPFGTEAIRGGLDVEISAMMNRIARREAMVTTALVALLLFLSALPQAFANSNATVPDGTVATIAIDKDGNVIGIQNTNSTQGAPVDKYCGEPSEGFEDIEDADEAETESTLVRDCHDALRIRVRDTVDGTRKLCFFILKDFIICIDL
jgi:hypothetical protein